MDIMIKVLDVNDADAVIVHLRKDTQQLVFLIDGGRDSNNSQVLKELNETLDVAGKKAPDFILCTHYDSDHIGGLTAVINAFKEYKPLVWMHKTSEQVDIEKFKKSLILAGQESSIYPTEADTYLGGNMGVDQQYYVKAITNVEHEKKLIKLMDTLDIKCKEPLVENFTIEGWPELQILSPSIEFYQKLFPEKFTTEQLLSLSAQQIKKDSTNQISSLDTEVDPFIALDKIKKNGITSTNMNSAVLLLDSNGIKFLFAADAGIDAFSQIPVDVLTDIYWLKVPHHGSKNNITSDNIKLMKPVNAVISGRKLIAPEVVSCLSAVGSMVSTTKDSGTIVFCETH
jgi:beta-lactamase superfamily II metal-dependent hydrolase